MSQRLHERWTALIGRLHAHQRLLVAFSGGCDSAFLLAAARWALGREKVLAVMAVSPSLARGEKAAAEALAAALDAPFLAVETHELANPRYRSNPNNRCFYCKEELFTQLAPIARGRSMTLADGFNWSDRSDVRPGRQAADAAGVVHPLEEARLSKRDIRALSRWRSLPTWNKPAAPCLSSRIPYGTRVTEEVLDRIDRAERIVRQEGFRILRVRHHGEEARIEVPVHDIPRLTEPARWARVARQLRAIGYPRVSFQPDGFRSGRLNNL